MSWALVTGASSGMGLRYADQLASRGNNILLVSNQKEELQKAADDLKSKYGISAVPYYQDLAAADAAAQLFDFCREQKLEIDILVNNAGMFFFKELFPEDERRIDTMMQLHMTVITKLSLLFGNEMKRRGHGHILIVSSLAAALPMPGITIYAATKAYLKNFGRSLYFEMRPYGVSVTTVCPAAIATPLYNLSEKLLKLGVRTGIIWTPERLVRRAIRAMYHGRRIIRPGLMNIYLPPLIAILPKRLVNHLWQKFK